jgi:hypothetical protein
LNLRQSGFCTLDRLNDAHHTGRLLQRLRQPRHKVRLARKLYQAELPPDRLLQRKKHNLCVSFQHYRICLFACSGLPCLFRLENRENKNWVATQFLGVIC